MTNVFVEQPLASPGFAKYDMCKEYEEKLDKFSAYFFKQFWKNPVQSGELL